MRTDGIDLLLHINCYIQNGHSKQRVCHSVCACAHVCVAQALLAQQHGITQKHTLLKITN